MPVSTAPDTTLPALRRVRVANGSLHGEYIPRRDPKRQRQARLLEAYERAVGPDGRVPLKQGGSGALVGPLLEFLNLRQTDEGQPEQRAVRFTRAYGPLVWHECYARVSSRDVRTHERRRGVSGHCGRPLDRLAWSLPVAEFWRQQRRFRALIELVTAVQSAPERLPALLRDAIDILPQIQRTFGRGEVGDDSETLRSHALEYLRDYENVAPSPLRTYALTTRVGELVGGLLTEKTPRPKVVFDPEEGFRYVPEFAGVLDVLYFLVMRSLPSFRFCGNCGAVYFKNRPDKNTCGQRCAKLLGNRRWARAHPEANRKAKRLAAAREAARRGSLA